MAKLYSVLAHKMNFRGLGLIWSTMGLRVRVYSIFSAVFLLGFVIIVLSSMRAVEGGETNARLEAMQSLMTAMMATGHDAPQNAETSSLSRPFGPIGETDYAASHQFAQFSPYYRGYNYRVIANNPMNSQDRPTEHEQELFSQIQAQLGNSEEAKTLEPIFAGKNIELVAPIRMRHACLGCHGDPHAAPSALLQVFGSQNGFGWLQGQIVGMRIVTVPSPLGWVGFGQIKHKIFWPALFWTLSFVGLVAVLEWMVIRPLLRVVTALEAASLGDVEALTLPIEKNGEFGVIAISLDRIKRSLSYAIRLLSDEKD
ncbi:Tll0287-like domain-containing protein [Kozakia baliensis]|uniref:HAMP domain-containing protein n=2 Tax=Kozakia baliensis TaxID=153496 RepID=A0A1D8UT24_9PROT|nr:DUF3365 domain-containing protein [Kozakia baliensis]AOX16647.1 hypothetical protein A0U89_05350 [Kozakia baliensis]